eukprot:XP_027303725.1 uncharacterized protein LOC106020332 [Anas platyrhynchos]
MVRENAMKLFSVCMERVLQKHRRKMWRKVHNVLLTLHLRVSEENRSVAKAAQEALMAWSELLWWDELQEVAHMNQTLGIRTCLPDPWARGRNHRDKSEEKVYKIIAILEPMKNDVEPLVCEETARTIRTLRQHLHWLQRPWDPWYMLAVHCCLLQRLWQVLKEKPEPQKNLEETSEPEDSSLDSSLWKSTDR